MVEVKDYSNWDIYDGAAEGSGRSEKVWLKNNDGTIGLFKFPKIDPDTQQETTEHISEHLAHQIGNVLEVATADVDIGMYHGRIGSMSYQINKSNEYLSEGINFVTRSFPNYDAERMIDVSTGKHYCLEHIFESTKDFLHHYKEDWIEMLVFDFLIGNSDRHQNNWALLFSPTENFANNVKIFAVKRCPLYDNGSSLCCYVNDAMLDGCLGRDQNRFRSLVDSKSRAIVRIDGLGGRPRHSELVKYLLEQCPETVSICQKFLHKINAQVIDNILDQYQPEILNPRKNELIRKFLKRKVEILSELMERR